MRHQSWMRRTETRPRHEVLDAQLEVVGDVRRAVEDLERLLRPVPDPLGFVGIDGRRPLRELGVVDLDDRQDLDVGGIAEDADGELAAADEALDDDRLLVERRSPHATRS